MWEIFLGIAALVAIIAFHCKVDDYFFDYISETGKRLLDRGKKQEERKWKG